jgi:hypothetical protein
LKRNSTPAIIASSLAVALAGVGIDRAHADDWHWDPRVDLSGDYNSNYGLESGNVENVSVAGTVLDAAMKVSVLDPTTKFEITPRVRALYFPGESQFDANDLYLNSQFQELWERANFTFNEFFWSQDILQSYLPSTNIGVPLGQNSPGADLAAVNQRVRQNLLLLTPTGTFDLSAREQLQAQVQYLGIDYSREIYNEVQNFRNFSGSIGLASAITAQSSVTIRGIAADLDPTTGSGARTYGAEGEWDTHLSERMQAYAKLGVEHTSFDLAQYGKSSDTSISGGAGISRKFVAYDLFADFSRSVAPDSAGAVVARNDLRVRLEHKFTERASGYLGLRGIDQQALGNSIGFTGQRYGQAAIGVEWRWLRQFSIISEYAYTSFKEGDAQSAGSNAVTITLRYEPHRPAQEIGVDIGRY